jgi:hypothetical protein
MNAKDALGVVEFDDVTLEDVVADDSVIAQECVATVVFEEWDVGPG